MSKKADKPVTLESLAIEMRAGFAAVRSETAKAVDLAHVEEKLDHLTERVNDLSDFARCREKVERISDVIRHELKVDV